MNRDLKLHLRWLAALAVLPACGDDGATVPMGTDSETDSDTSSSDTITTTITTDPDSSSTEPGSSSTDPGSSSTDPGTSATDPDSSSGEASSSSGDPSGSESSSTGPGRECGNDMIEGAEVCDGLDLADATCESLGFGPGTLGCAGDCTAFDTTQCAPPTECGNDLVEDGEDCDGTDLADETCELQGFDAGTLACADDCTFDQSGCVNFSCGDGMINGPDECDGDDLPADATCADAGFGVGTVVCLGNCTLDFTGCCGDGSIGGAEVCDGDAQGGETCQTQGNFDAGTLACAGTCDGFDTSACTLCGDDEAEGAEACDGTDLLGADCTTVPGGFFGGTLACDAGCGYDTSGCNFCGNAAIDAGEDCDGAALGGATCLDLGHTGGDLGCQLGCSFDESGCTDFPLPIAGELVISEIMQNPTAVDDAQGEYFELHNPSLMGSFQLRSCVVEGGGNGESFTIDTDLVVDAGDYVTLATGANPGFVPDFAWPGAFALVNGSDTVRVVCDGVTVDEVTYDDGATFPDPAGASMQLDPGSLDDVANDDGSNWCASATPFGPGDLGTPGAANTACSAPQYNVDFCRLQFPTSVLDLEGTAVDVFGRLFIGGLTELSGVNDPAINVQMQVGYGGDGTDPEVDAGWTWTSGAPNAGYGPASPAYEANNDEYVATMILPMPGAYDFAVRFTGDGGATYEYCDGGAAGSSDGYAPANAGQMTSVQAGDPAVLYFSEYYEGTGLNKALEIYNPSATAVNLAACTVFIYPNGAVDPNPVNGIVLAGMVNDDDVFVLCNGALVQPFCDQSTGSVAFSGDDAIELRCDGNTVDSFGQVGVDPGAEWSGGDPVVGTIDEVLRRSCSVTQGDPIEDDAFDPSIEWTSEPIIAANPQPEHIDDLGLYVCP